MKQDFTFWSDIRKTIKKQFPDARLLVTSGYIKNIYKKKVIYLKINSENGNSYKKIKLFCKKIKADGFSTHVVTYKNKIMAFSILLSFNEDKS